ncbi:outer membrane protein assembly factor BamD [Dasania sp. GY-MA-18]|uniref:Outer membrane protein assembly factor BamD n=1 Tax=Dasania phycosphaerae TaxID=2950436 RepID=A0A9J6RNY6_9GAMM|nr:MULTISPECIES: outer membrane protein assembly factor BamD [Dasania]MCR8923591.1 outer membrane protein assembly factor BamD [Dasania sp. GY-MA-18]MCZ0866025.1 outer membrane protein assembly factor BamD [Dasania phycosphaerae]MCZ0869749.1 outer membrane protein assembly factor BamD [Dasania phycosphaerae]
MNTVVKTIFLSALLGLSACATDDVSPQDLSERELYDRAQQSLDDMRFDTAVKRFQLLEARFPFGPYAEQAQLEIIYAHLRSIEPEAAIAAADRFIRLHPQSPNLDYAYYMKGLANYTEGDGFLDQFMPTDMTERDPGSALKAFEDFRQLLYRFPDSSYAPDARARMVYLRNRLARYEINVANYYFKRKAYVAAANRGRYVVENYSQTPAVADGLAVMIQAYMLLGLDDLAENSLKVLASNHPKHPSLDKKGRFIPKFTLEDEEGSTINKLTLGLFDRADPPKFDNRPDYMIR